MSADSAIKVDTAISAAAKALAAMLRSDDLQRVWCHHHATQKDKNPAHEIAARIEADPVVIKKDPVFYMMARNVAELLHGGMRKSSEREKALGDLAFFIKGLRDENLKYPKRHELPEAYQDLLNVIGHETQQEEFTPIRSSIEFTKKLGRHFSGDIRKNPKMFGAALSLALASMWFMNARLGNSATTYIDPQLMGISDLSPQALMESMQTGKKLTVDPSLIPKQFSNSCHDHAVDLFGKQAADHLPGFMANMHCGKFMTMAQDMQGNLQGLYGGMTKRLAMFTGDRVSEVAEALPHCSFVDGFKWGTDKSAKRIYELDYLENISFHSLIFLWTFMSVRKTLTLDTEEAREQKERVTDIFHRAVHIKPLNYMAASAGVAHAYVAGGGLNAHMIWEGAAGAVLGTAAHKLINYVGDKGFKNSVKLAAPLQDHLNEIKEWAARIADIKMSAANTQEAEPDRLKQSFAFAGRHKKLCIAFGCAVLASTLAGADMKGALDAMPITHPAAARALKMISWNLGAGTGIGSVAGTYFGVNIPQDIGLHTIIIAFAAAVGGAEGMTERGVKWLASKIRFHKPEHSGAL